MTNSVTLWQKKTVKRGRVREQCQLSAKSGNWPAKQSSIWGGQRRRTSATLNTNLRICLWFLCYRYGLGTTNTHHSHLLAGWLPSSYLVWCVCRRIYRGRSIYFLRTAARLKYFHDNTILKFLEPTTHSKWMCGCDKCLQNKIYNFPHGLFGILFIYVMLGRWLKILFNVWFRVLTGNPLGICWTCHPKGVYANKRGILLFNFSIGECRPFRTPRRPPRQVNSLSVPWNLLT